MDFTTSRSIYNISDVHARANLPTETANSQLIKRLACELKAHPAAEDDGTLGELDLPSSIVLVRKQINLVIPEVALLQKSYASLVEFCHEHCSSVIEKYKDVRSIASLMEKALAMSQLVKTRQVVEEIGNGLDALGVILRDRNPGRGFGHWVKNLFLS
ncbi:MAG: hypothetical protein Q9210_006827 [Variospora velana]